MKNIWLLAFLILMSPLAFGHEGHGDHPAPITPVPVAPLPDQTPGGHEGHGAGGALLDGRYIGWIKFDSAKERIAVVTDIFQESPEDFTLDPSRNAIFKMSLGGYNTHEYYTETFKDIHSDFDNGTLTLDESNNDLLITAEVHALGATPIIVGQVFVRSSAVWGTLYLKYETDEPDARLRRTTSNDEPGGSGSDGEPGEPGEDEPGEQPETSPFIPLLEGQYVGLCNGGPAALQIQTVRGLKTRAQKDFDTYGLSAHYGIVARISGSGCGTVPEGFWCNNFNYAEASYNIYKGELVLKGQHSSDRCEIRQGEVKCRIQVQGGAKVCVLKKTGNIAGPRFFTRRFHLSPTANQTTKLPEAAPPKNAALTAALRGTFSGYIHNETNDTYQAIQLNVLPYSTTNNPHNLNQMAVATTSSVYLGQDASGSFTTQRFEPRSFYIRPGFSLSASKSDGFLSIPTIDDWQTGFIRGIWYSHNFGRVGTVELIKGPLPKADPSMAMVQNFAGQYRGGSPAPVKRWIELNFPAQPNLQEEHVITFDGSQQSIVGITAVQNIEKGTFDPYTGRFAWIYSHGGGETFISAYLSPSSDLRIYWPPSPGVFGVLMVDFGFETYKRLKLP